MLGPREKEGYRWLTGKPDKVGGLTDFFVFDIV